MQIKYQVTKTYGHEQGLSCVFRQYPARSHCAQLHGYALAVSLTFEAETLNAKNWVTDFGGLKEVKGFLAETFDHKLLVAEADPFKDELCELGGLGLANPVVVPVVGCEGFATLIFDWVTDWMKWQPEMEANKVRLINVTVAEHAGNQASVVAA